MRIDRETIWRQRYRNSGQNWLPKPDTVTDPVGMCPVNELYHDMDHFWTLKKVQTFYPLQRPEVVKVCIKGIHERLQVAAQFFTQPTEVADAVEVVPIN